MREIKFRAKDKNENIWHFGMLTYANFNHGVELAIAVKSELGSIFIVRIDPKTISQYTGIKDKNGVEIYEGDIVRLFCDCSGYYIEPRWVNAIIVWNEDLYGWEISFEHIRVGYSECIGNFKYDYDAQIEVIGNIYDNPELLEENKDE